MQILIDQVDQVVAANTTTTTFSYDVSRADRFSIQAIIDVLAPAAATFTAAVTDIITQVAHGYLTGLKLRFTTTTTLPAGLSLATDYFVIKIDADTYYVATSLALALAGTAVNITGTGTGVHTATPVALAGGFIKLEKSNDGTNWTDEIADAAVTADATVWLEVDPNSLNMKFVRPRITLTAGSISVDYHVLSKAN